MKKQLGLVFSFIFGLSLSLASSSYAQYPSPTFQNLTILGTCTGCGGGGGGGIIGPTAGTIMISPGATGTATGLAATSGNIPFVSGSAWTGMSLSSIIDSQFGSTQGSILYRGAATWTSLAPGTSGQFLQSLGSGANPNWANGSGSTSPGGSNTQVQFNNTGAFAGSSGLTLNATKVTSEALALGSDTAGDIYYNGGSGVLTRLGIGTAGQILTVSSGLPAWASSGTVPFSNLTGGTNTSAAMVVGSGATLGATGSGSITATSVPASGITGQVVVSNGGTGLSSLLAGTVPMGAGTAAFASSEITDVASGGVTVGSPTGGQKGPGTINMTGCFINNVACASGSAPSFSAITSGTNTSAAMLVGTGSSLAATGSGTITATSMPTTGLTGNLTFAQLPQITGPTILGRVTNTLGSASAAYTPSNGTDTGVALVHGATVVNDCPKFSDTSGTIVDNGTPCASSTTFTLSPGFASNTATYNSGSQTITNGSTLSAQVFYKAEAASCTLNSTCNSPSTNDSGLLPTPTAASVTITTPSPGAVGSASYQVGYDGTHSYTLATPSGNIYGCGTTGATVSGIVYQTQLISDGTNWQCVPSGSGITGLTNNTILKATGSSTLGNSSIVDNGTSITIGNPIQNLSAVTETMTISTATFTPDLGAGINHQATLVHASCPCTIANPSNISTHVGETGMLDIIQSSTGTDIIGTWGSQYITPGGTSTLTLSTAANAIDHIAYRVIDSTHVLLSPVQLNATH